jgi:hypothetical protein
MPEFISKLQFKDDEKGEYSEEKARSLEETIDLIKKFPWDEQRGAAIELTGPSITIQDEDSNFLKAGLYFNGKYCIYYLSNTHHLYEYHSDDLDIITERAGDFFNGQLPIDQFERQLISIGARGHMEDGVFEYRISKIAIVFNLLWSGGIACFLSICAIIVIAGGGTASERYIFPLPLLFVVFLFFGFFYFIMKVYMKAKDMSLYLKRGKDNFKFCDYGVTETYSKSNIFEINVIGNTMRSSALFNLMEVVFKDGTSIIIPGVLIDPFKFAEKFPGCQVNYKGGYFLTSKKFWDYIR